MSKKDFSPLILKGNLKSKIKDHPNTEIIMHGEDHSKIDNSYYEQLLTQPLNGKILVEHSTNSCEVKPEDEHLFKQHAKGSEWIFYTLKMLKNLNVICFDTRSEHGYLNAFQEQAVFDAAERLVTGDLNDVKIFLEGVKINIATFYRNEEFFNVLPGYVERSLTVLSSQLNTVSTLLKLRKGKGNDYLVCDIPVKDLLRGVALTLAANIRKVASVSVDLSLINTVLLLHMKGEKEINIFTGKNHVVRLSKLLELKNMKITGMTKKLEVLAEIELDGDLDMDKKICAINQKS